TFPINFTDFHVHHCASFSAILSKKASSGTRFPKSSRIHRIEPLPSLKYLGHARLSASFYFGKNNGITEST
uniref:hypothetical protein n=1 Tax=Parasutterella excrementihominis TaxID=487175 RepID=UPI003FEE816F